MAGQYNKLALLVILNRIMASEQRSNPRDTPRHTPSNSRSYLNLPHSIRQSPQNTGTPHMIQETNSNASEDTGVIYGTNISTKNVIGLL